MSSEIEEISGRLKAVERSMRRYRAALLAAGLIAAAGLARPWPVGAEKATQVITAKCFMVVDDGGKIRAALGEGKHGAVLELYDEAGKTRAMLADDKHGPRLVLYDDAEKWRATLSVDKDGPALSLLDEAGKERAVLGTTEVKNAKTGSTERRAESSLELFNESGQVLWEAP